MRHRIEITGDRMTVLDTEGCGWDGHQLKSLSEAERQLEAWRDEYEFDYTGAIQAISDYFSTEAAETRRVHADAAIERIGRTVLHLPTLRPRGSDNLDFHELGVGAVRLALRAAYEAGRASVE